jgi:hypothetical protein
MPRTIMNHPVRKRRPIVSLARSVAILSLITCIASLLFLEPIIRAMYASRYSVPSDQGIVNSLVGIIVSLRYCVWVGLLLAPIVRWLYTQAKLSDRQARQILRVIAIVEFGYLLINLCAAVTLGWFVWAWRNW